MKAEEIKVCILRIEGTNCEAEMFRAFEILGAQPELVHLKQLIGMDVKEEEKRKLSDYQILMFPGGFSAGDYIRAGAIWAARIKASLKQQLLSFAEDGYAIGGVCNGFQVLIELGFLPGLETRMADRPEAALGVNDSGRFECRPSMLKFVNDGKCNFTSKITKDDILVMPVAHAEGKFILEETKEKDLLKTLEDNDQVVFKYVNSEGDETAGYPYNPNGSIENIAGICSKDGNIFGMMPHPERVIERMNQPDWYRKITDQISPEMKFDYGDGILIFQSILEYIERNF